MPNCFVTVPLQELTDHPSTIPIYIDCDPIESFPLVAFQGSIAINSITKHVFIYTEDNSGELCWRFIGIAPENLQQIEKVHLHKYPDIECPICGITSGTILQTHHIDRNRKNNNPENLFTFCPKCHLSTHNFINYGLSERGSLELTITLGKIFKKSGFYNLDLRITRKEAMDGCIRAAFLKENIKVNPYSIGFHSSKKHRIYCDVGDLDHQFIKDFLDEHKIHMGEFVFISLAKNITKILKDGKRRS